VNGGAVAYLTHSQYGRNGNEIARNDSSGYYTGRSKGSLTVSGSTVEGAYKYNEGEGMLASTSGNEYGIYDMSGGAWEYVAAWDAESTNSDIRSNGSSFATSGGSSTKYATSYHNRMTSSETGYNYPTSEKCILGDAIYEVNVNPRSSYYAWFNDYSYCASSTSPFLLRGGACNDGTYAGAFYSYYGAGYSHNNGSFRVTIPGGKIPDTIKPIISVSPGSSTEVVKTRNIVIDVTDPDYSSGLSTTNTYQYYLSKSQTAPTPADQTGTYTPGKVTNIGAGLTGDYYLFLPIVADNDGNTSIATITGYYRTGPYTFDNTAPTVSKVELGSATTKGFKVTITGADTGKAGIKNYTIYYKKQSESNYHPQTITGNSYTFTNLAANTTYNVYVTATDNVGNTSRNTSVENIKTKAEVVEDGTWDSEKNVNGPYLYAGLNPVIWVNGTEITKYTDPTNKTGINSNWTSNNGDKVWYDYKTGTGDHKSSQWANAVDTNGSYYVWIPRYEYKIASGNPGTIAVNFIGKNKTVPTSGYIIHPAFCTNVDLGGYGTELSGIWVAKYEACNVSNKPVSKPNAWSWINIKIGDCYEKSYNYNRDMDSHLMKNSEWRSSSIFNT